jgi:DNA/RNA-binding domain of Phe-tRNA-synthetase-like protein
VSRALVLDDGRRLSLGPDVAELISCGVLVAAPVAVGRSPTLDAELDAIARRLRDAHGARPPGAIAALQEARRLYRACGVDPTRTRPSSEALLRRVLKGRDLHRINSAVDACNLASLSFLLPIGLYDLDRVSGDVTLRLGAAGEEYPGLRKGPVHLAGRPGLFDAGGPFGSPTSDSARTAVREGTRRLLAVIMATAAYPARALEADLDLLSRLLAEHDVGPTVLRGRLGGKESP